MEDCSLCMAAYSGCCGLYSILLSGGTSQPTPAASPAPACPPAAAAVSGAAAASARTTPSAAAPSQPVQGGSLLGDVCCMCIEGAYLPASDEEVRASAPVARPMARPAASISRNDALPLPITSPPLPPAATVPPRTSRAGTGTAPAVGDAAAAIAAAVAVATPSAPPLASPPSTGTTVGAAWSIRDDPLLAKIAAAQRSRSGGGGGGVSQRLGRINWGDLEFLGCLGEDLHSKARSELPPTPCLNWPRFASPDLALTPYAAPLFPSCTTNRAQVYRCRWQGTQVAVKILLPGQGGSLALPPETMARLEEVGRRLSAAPTGRGALPAP